MNQQQQQNQTQNPNQAAFSAQDPAQDQQQGTQQQYETMSDTKTSKKKEFQSTQKIIDIDSIKDGVIVLKNKGLRSVLMCSSINFALMSDEEQKAKLYAYQDFLNSLSFPVQIVIQSKKLNIKRYIEKVKNAERLQENDHLRMQTAQYADFVLSLVELANITTNRFYVVVPYTNPLRQQQSSGGPLDTVKKFFSPAKQVQETMSLFEQDKKELILRVQTVVSGLQGIGVKAAVLDTEEIIELLYSVYNPEVAQNQVLTDLEKIRLENM